MTRIVDYSLFAVPPRWLFLRLVTDDGLVGWGEPIVEGRAKTVEMATEELIETYLLDEDPAPIADIWEELYRGGFYRGGPILMSALAGIDQALWDLKGKRHDAPVHELLGGPVRDRIRAYGWIGGDRPAAVRSAAERRIENGFTAVKLNATAEFDRIESPDAIHTVRERLWSVRDAVGPEVDIGIDFHGRIHKSMAKRLAHSLEPIEPMFFEEPIGPEHDEALSQVAEQTSIPIATGERWYSRHDFKGALETGSVDVIQPDVSHAGGITEVIKIASMADAYDVALAPHCPLGPIALSASLQVDAVAPNATIQETSAGIHYNDSTDLFTYLENESTLRTRDGYLPIPDNPGLGIELDEETIESRRGDTSWNNPVWRHPDGRVAEW